MVSVKKIYKYQLDIENKAFGMPFAFRINAGLGGRKPDYAKRRCKKRETEN
jgi:hypothetical protein